MKEWSWLVAGLVAANVQAETLVFRMDGAEAVTGDHIDGAGWAGITTNVVEIEGLQITASTGAENQTINGTGSANSMGIKIHGSGHSTRFDQGETMTLSFSKKVNITAFDLVGFDSNAVFVVDITGAPAIQIGEEALAAYETYPCDLTLDAGTTLSLSVGNSNSVIGLQAMELAVMEETGGMSLSLSSSNGMAYVAAGFSETATTNYVLQSCTNLTSNVWATVSDSFSADTNWSFNASNEVRFYRIIEQ